MKTVNENRWFAKNFSDIAAIEQIIGIDFPDGEISSTDRTCDILFAEKPSDAFYEALDNLATIDNDAVDIVEQNGIYIGNVQGVDFYHIKGKLTFTFFYK